MALNGLADALAAQGDAARALEAILQSLRIKETPSAKRIFVDIVKQLRWTNDNREVRRTMARALTEPWARPGELAHTQRQPHQAERAYRRLRGAGRAGLAAVLVGAGIVRSGRPRGLANDELLLALLVSAQNTDIELERFLTMARRVLLEAAEGRWRG